MFEFTDASEDTNLTQIRIQRMVKNARNKPAYRTALSIWAKRRRLINDVAALLHELEQIETEEHPEERVA